MKTRLWYLGVVAVLAAMSGVLASSAGAGRLADGATVSGVTPTHAVAGQRVTIYGSSLNGMSTVTFGGVPARSVVVDPGGQWVRAVVPAGVPTGQVPVRLSDGSIVLSASLQIGPGSVPAAANRPPSYTSPGARVKVVVAPQVTGFSPTRGRVGSTVRIMGASLNGALWVMFGGVRAHVTKSSPSAVLALVPKNAHTGKIKVHTSGGTSVSSGIFRVLAPGAGV